MKDVCVCFEEFRVVVKDYGFTVVVLLSTGVYRDFSRLTSFF